MIDSSHLKATSQAQQRDTAEKRDIWQWLGRCTTLGNSSKDKGVNSTHAALEKSCSFLHKIGSKCCESPNSQFNSEIHSAEREQRRNICAGKIY